MVDVLSRPDEELHGVTYKTKCGCGSIYITINEYQGKPVEVFINLGKGGICANVMLGAMGRDISHGLRGGVPLEEFSRTHFGSRCDSQITSIQNKGKPMFSCLDAIAKVFIEYLKKRNPNPPGAIIIPMNEPTIQSSPKPTPITSPELQPKSYTEPPKPTEEPKPQSEGVRMGGKICGNCGGGPIVREGSCEVCKSCGDSKCL